MQGVGVLSFHFNGSVGMACVDSLSIATETSTPLNARLFYWGFNFCAYVLPLTLSSLFYFLLVRSIWKQKMVQSKSSEKMKKHATKMVFIVIITFGFCWFPQNLRFFLRGLSYPDMTFWEESAPELLLYVQSTIQVLAYANSCVNPILYGVLSERFRVGVNTLLEKKINLSQNCQRTSTNQTRALQLSQPTYPEFSSKSNGLGCDSHSKLNFNSRMSIASTCHADEFLPVTPKSSFRSASRSPSLAPTSLSFNYTESNNNFGSNSNCSIVSKMPTILVGEYDFEDSEVVLL
uniref:G-protein coupled receptors family 1 profile domain-containing protein n=1 Tax=Ditylenchus dipsaci TaxID=166011 RepID=A0A915CU06_9BILA